MYKIAAQVQHSYSMSEQEIIRADNSIVALNQLLGHVEAFDKYFEKFESAFKNTPNTSDEEIFKFRKNVRDFRDEAENKIRVVKDSYLACVQVMKPFSSDTQIDRILDSFVSSFKSLEDKFVEFRNSFSKIGDDGFLQSTLEFIEIIHKKAEEFRNIIEERVKGHIQSNILGSDWRSEVDSSLAPSDKPFDVQLFMKQEKALKTNRE